MLKVISVPALDSLVLTAREQQVGLWYKLSQQWEEKEGERGRRRRGGGGEGEEREEEEKEGGRERRRRGEEEEKEGGRGRRRRRRRPLLKLHTIPHTTVHDMVATPHLHTHNTVIMSKDGLVTVSIVKAPHTNVLVC